MKTTAYLFAALASCAVVTSCDDSYNEWEEPENFQNNATTSFSYDLTVTPAATIDLGTVTSHAVNLFTAASSAGTVTAVNTNVYNKEVDPTASGYVTTKESFYEEYDLDANGTIETAVLQQLVNDIYGKAPVARTLSLYLTADVAQGEKTYRSYAMTQVQVIPAVAHYISEAYYLYNPTTATTVPFTHDEETNVYDDPTFSVTVESTTASQPWLILSAEALAANRTSGEGVFGVVLDGDESTAGYLEEGASAQAGALGQPAKYRLSVNMETRSYEIKEVKYDAFVYFIGATDGWAKADQRLALADEDKGIYKGFVYMADPNNWGLGCKFQTVQGSWDEALSATTLSAMTGCTGDDNIYFPSAGVFYVEINRSEGSIAVTAITNMNLVGQFNGWNQTDEAQRMTWNADLRRYEFTHATVTNEGWKFTANDAWDINLGGEANALDYGKDNLTATGSTIYLYPTRTDNDNIYCTIEP